MNYRGSLGEFLRSNATESINIVARPANQGIRFGIQGFGEVNLRSLPGRIGDFDVKDCYQAAKAVDASLVSDLLLFGGSHGGFLVAHLAGL